MDKLLILLIENGETSMFTNEEERKKERKNNRVEGKSKYLHETRDTFVVGLFLGFLVYWLW